MEIDLEIPEEAVDSIERYLDTQRISVPNEVGAVESRRIYPTVADFVIHQLGTLIKSITDQYPPASQVEKLRRIKALNEEMVADARPRKREKK